jgi:hypothetical protein
VDTLGFVALALALGGLVAAVLEVVLKNPGAVLELAQDSGRFAREPAPVVRLGRIAGAPKAPANDGGRAAA